MLILGIETSCDETAASVVRSGREILSNIVFSQIKTHAKTGGVVPEVAGREHAVKIVPVIKKTLKEAKITLAEIDAIAVTQGPGLQTSLLTGVNAANILAMVLKKPLIPVNHVEGHIYANFINSDQWPVISDQPNFPIVVLTASGGHNELILWLDHGKYKFLGSTLDDAAGEAFDKVGRLLDLPYPGGPFIEKLAKKGDPKVFPLPLPYPKTFNFSFSGIKTAVLYLIRDITNGNKRKLTAKERACIAASFQKVMCEVLARKLILAAEKYKAKEIHLAGGVSANSALREKIVVMVRPLDNLRAGSAHHDRGKPIFRFPHLSLCTDNAAMVATAGFFKFSKSPGKYENSAPVIPDPNLKIKNW